MKSLKYILQISIAQLTTFILVHFNVKCKNIESSQFQKKNYNIIGIAYLLRGQKSMYEISHTINFVENYKLSHQKYFLQKQIMNSKAPNPTARQATLTQMNQVLSNKISQSIQASSKKKTSTSNRPNSSNKKPQIHEIINLQNEDLQNGFNSRNIAQGKNQEAFVSELAKKCGAFFNWINQVDYAIFAEQLWKNKMMALVGEKFPELNTGEQQKLIDRDWKIMAPQRKQELFRNLQNQLEFQHMNKSINQDFQRQRNEIYVQFNGK